MDDPRRLWWALGCGDHLTANDRRNLRRFNWWSFAWTISFVGAIFALERELVTGSALRWAVALVPSLLGLVAISRYVRFLREADELLRKIQLEGLAFGFGLVLVFMLGYPLAERAGAPELAVSDPIFALCGGWVVGVWLAGRKYR